MATASEKGIAIQVDEEGCYRVVWPEEVKRGTLWMGSYGTMIANLFRPPNVAKINEESRAKIVGASDDGYLLVLLQNRTIMAVDAREDSYFE